MTTTKKRTKPRKPRLTEDEKLRRRASRKAEAVNAKAIRGAELFADQVPLTTAAAEYWKARRGWALVPRGAEAACLGGIEDKIDLMLIRQLARAVMKAEDYALAVSKSNNYGSVLDFWRNILLGRRRLVIAYERVSLGWKPCFLDKAATACCEHGCRQCESKLIRYIESVQMTEKLVWPPAGYVAPMTAAELEARLGIPPAEEFAGQVDPLHLREATTVQLEEERGSQ